MNLFDFNPRPAEVVIDGVAYKLMPFSLEVMQWIAIEYSDAIKKNPDDPDEPAPTPNGLQNFDRIINNWKDWEPFAGLVCEVVYYMLEDRDTFPSICAFKRSINATSQKDGGPSGGVARLFKGLAEAMGNSQPQFDAAEKELHLLELKKKLRQKDRELARRDEIISELRSLIGQISTQPLPEKSRSILNSFTDSRIGKSIFSSEKSTSKNGRS